MDFSVNVTVTQDMTAELLEKLKDQTQRKAALEVHSELISTTPVDTGRARAGWGVSADGVGSYIPSVITQPEKWKQGNAPYYPQPRALQTPKGASFIVLYNNVEYIGYLNNGTSSQAPRMFVEKAVEKVARGFK